MTANEKLHAFIFIGAGGHAKVLLDALSDGDAEIIGVIDPKVATNGPRWRGHKIYSSDADIGSLQRMPVKLVNAVGFLPYSDKREKIFHHYSDMGMRFASVIHPSAVVTTKYATGQGVQIMAGAHVGVDSLLGDNSIINTGAIVEHDCHIGSHVHVASGAVVAGGVTIADRVFVGAGAVLLQGISIAPGAVIGAGTTVTRDVAANHRVVGQQARPATRI